jgi:hypothetical protein
MSRVPIHDIAKIKIGLPRVFFKYVSWDFENLTSIYRDPKFIISMTRAAKNLLLFKVFAYECIVLENVLRFII